MSNFRTTVNFKMSKTRTVHGYRSGVERDEMGREFE
jgi:hypothetical protein